MHPDQRDLTSGTSDSRTHVSGRFLTDFFRALERQGIPARELVGDLPIPAIEAGRVAVIDDPHALLPSTSLVGFADALAELLERWGRGETEPSPAGDTP